MSIEWMRSAASNVTSAPFVRPKSRKAVRDTAPACVICNRGATSSFVVHAYRFFVCSACDFAFIDPATAAAFSSRATFDDDYFLGGGAGYTNYLHEAQMLRAHGSRYGKVLVDVGARSVLDIGAAAGFVLRGMQEAGCAGMGIEPNPTMAAFAVRELGLDVRATTLEEFDYAERFDATTLLQVVDHLEDVRLAFARIAALTKPGGHCLIEFGNRASIIARVLGTAWHEYAPPSVQRVFSLRALQRLLSDYGFALRGSGHPKKYLRADHALSLLRFKAGALLGDTVVARLAGVIPPHAKLRYLGDDITWALFTRS